MISVGTYNDYFKQLISRVSGLKSFILIANEPQLADNIRNMDDSEFPALVALIPSADSISRDPDNILETSTCLIYVLKKFEHNDQTPTTFLSVMLETQNIMQAIKLQMLADRADHAIFSHLLERIDLSRMHTDPEYNYLGCNGWSLSFLISTPGY
ncbi:MAG: hypothetical protein ACOYMF_05280 [Bacteroidales bacterium]